MKTGIAGPILWITATAVVPGVVWVLTSHVEASASHHLRIMANPPHSITLAYNYGDRFLASYHQDMCPKLGRVVGGTMARGNQISMLRKVKVGARTTHLTQTTDRH